MLLSIRQAGAGLTEMFEKHYVYLSFYINERYTGEQHNETKQRLDLILDCHECLLLGDQSIISSLRNTRANNPLDCILAWAYAKDMSILERSCLLHQKFQVDKQQSESCA